MFIELAGGKMRVRWSNTIEEINDESSPVSVMLITEPRRVRMTTSSGYLHSI